MSAISASTLIIGPQAQPGNTSNHLWGEMAFYRSD
jgi:hypothetical protein